MGFASSMPNHSGIAALIPIHENENPDKMGNLIVGSWASVDRNGQRCRYTVKTFDQLACEGFGIRKVISLLKISTVCL
jgi:hypothetical protein